MRTAILLTLTVALTASLAHGVRNTHLNEIAVPVLEYADGRVPVLDAQGSLSKAEKVERRQLVKLQKKLPKDAPLLKNGLRHDFKELRLSTKGAKRMKDAAVLMRDALDEAFDRAELALDDRRDTIGDHLALIADLKKAGKVQKDVTKGTDARAKANAAPTDDQRAKFLGKAERFLTRALTKAEKAVRLEGKPLPPVRVRSGDRVGTGGALVAYRGEAGDPLNGAWVLISPGALTQNTVINLEAAADFVTEPDVPAGPALLIRPDGLALTGAPSVVNLPLVMAPGSDPESVGVFHKTAGGSEGTLDVERVGTGFVRGDIRTFGTYQVGQLAPPEGAPGGLFHLQMLGILSRPGEGATPDPTLFVRVFDQDIRFRADGSGQGLQGNQPALTRTFTRTDPHHVDLANSLPAGAFSFDWTTSAPGHFAFGLPFGTEIVDIRGVLSNDGRVFAVTGRSGNFEVFGIGVKGGTNVTAADLQGRWVCTQLTAEFANPGADPGAIPPRLYSTPFETVWTNGFGWFDADAAGKLTYDAAGILHETKVTHDTSVATPVQSHVVATMSQGGDTTVNVSATGRISDATFQRSGWLDPEAGVYVSTVLDAANRRIAFEIAVRQTSGTGDGGFAGAFHFAKLDLGVSSNGSSANHDLLPSVGALQIPAMGPAQFDFDDAVRRNYDLAGPPPISDLLWSLTPSDTAVPAFTETLTPMLDGNGNHVDAADDRLFGVDQSGQILLGSRRNTIGEGRLGLFVGFADPPPP